MQQTPKTESLCVALRRELIFIKFNKVHMTKKKVPKKVMAFNLEETIIENIEEICEEEERNRSNTVNKILKDFFGKKVKK